MSLPTYSELLRTLSLAQETIAPVLCKIAAEQPNVNRFDLTEQVNVQLEASEIQSLYGAQQLICEMLSVHKASTIRPLTTGDTFTSDLLRRIQSSPEWPTILARFEGNSSSGGQG